MNGFDATRRIMESHPTPIVIVSGTADMTDTAKAFRAIECRRSGGVAKASWDWVIRDHEQTQRGPGANCEADVGSKV